MCDDGCWSGCGHGNKNNIAIHCWVNYGVWVWWMVGDNNMKEYSKGVLVGGNNNNIVLGKGGPRGREVAPDNEPGARRAPWG
jgi:hypothetical protein